MANPNWRTTPGREHAGAMETFNDTWWRDAYPELEGLQADRGYEHYRPAFEYGWSAYSRFPGRRWDDVEPDLERDWRGRHADRDWSDYKRAVRHSFERAMHVFEGDRDPDRRE